MTRICDNCKKTIPLGTNKIAVRFSGLKDMEKLFKTSELDFCSLQCLILFWSKNEREK